jgi:hypothetical protein
MILDLVVGTLHRLQAPLLLQPLYRSKRTTLGNILYLNPLGSTPKLFDLAMIALDIYI